jgi:hypothetical protein
MIGVFMSSSLLFALLLACGEKSSDTSSDEENTENSENTDDTDTNTTDTEEADPVKPVISNADAWCYTVGGSTEGDQWAFEFYMDDPQGIETIGRLQTDAITVKGASGVAVSTQTAACSWETGLCTARVFTDQVGVGCDSADSTTVEYQIIDEDDNLSEKTTVTGRFEETVE